MQIALPVLKQFTMIRGCKSDDSYEDGDPDANNPSDFRCFSNSERIRTPKATDSCAEFQVRSPQFLGPLTFSEPQEDPRVQQRGQLQGSRHRPSHFMCLLTLVELQEDPRVDSHEDRGPDSRNPCDC